MKKMPFVKMSVVIVSLLLLLPTLSNAQAEQAKPAPPPIGQQLFREGAFAIKLESGLALGTSEDEAEAESQLAEVGISPRNGWIADYPVTPDIIGELQKAVTDAAAANKLSLGKDEALKRFNDLSSELGLAIKPHTDGKSYESKGSNVENYPDPTVINNYYYNEGPPVVTYYAPPPDYYYLYSWVPYPFWWTGFWFPGFFILNDFHRTVVGGGRVRFVSNHFNDFRAHRVFRIDPVQRFRGRTFAGIGASGRRGFIPTGIARSDRRIFNGPRGWTPGGGRITGAPQRGSRAVGSPSSGIRRAGTGGGRGFIPRQR